MSKEYKFQKIQLIEKFTIFQTIFYYIVKIVAYFLAYITNCYKLGFGGLKVTEKAFDIQAVCCEENGRKIYRRKYAQNHVETNFRGMKTITEIIKNLVTNGPNKKLIGNRPLLKKYTIKDPTRSREVHELGSFEFFTAEEVYKKILKIAFFLKSINIERGDRVAIFAETSADFFMLKISTLLLRATYCTVYPNLANQYIIKCLELVEPKLLFIDSKCYSRIEAVFTNFSSIKCVLFSTDCQDLKINPVLMNLADCVFLSNILLSQTPPANFEEKLEKSEENDVATIMFTSGSTGNPKGVMLTNLNIVSLIAGVVDQEDIMKNQVYAAYLPLAHIFEVCCELSILAYGGCIGYCNPGTLFDSSPLLAPGCLSDLKALNPTATAAVTLVVHRIKAKTMEKLSKQSDLKRIVFEVFYNVKAEFIGHGYTTPLLDKLFFNRFKGLFGNRFYACLTGGAYLPPESEEFCNIVYGIFRQSYGATEVTGAGTIGRYEYFRPGHIGAPFCCSELRLESWKEGGFQNPQYPTGELLIAGPCVSPGYYKNPEMTKKSFEYDPITQKVWYRTEDIVQILEDGTLRIIGRKSERVKLVHGEYVQLSRVEDVIRLCSLVDFVCTIPNKANNYLIAIVCLNQENTINFAKSHNMIKNQNFDELIENINFQKMIELELKEVMKASDALNRFEIPKKYIYAHETWTIESDLLTPSMKIKRAKINQKYKQLIDSL